MKDFCTLLPNTIITVQRIAGGRDIKKSLETLGIMAGSDLTIVSLNDGLVTVDAGRGPVELSQEQAGAISYTDQFKRNGDPVLLGGCCGSGPVTDLLERYQEF